MKTKILSLMLLLIAIVASAQGRRKGQFAVQGNYGYMMKKDSITDQYMAKLGVSKVIGDKGLLGRAGIFYHNYKVDYADGIILPFQRYGLNVMAGYSFEGLAPVFINAYIGAYGAMEKVNEGNTRDPKFNALIPEKVDNFTYGAVGTAELEVFVLRRLSLVFDYTQYYDLKSKFSKANYGLFGGLKYTIN